MAGRELDEHHGRFLAKQCVAVEAALSSLFIAIERGPARAAGSFATAVCIERWLVLRDKSIAALHHKPSPIRGSP
jgi:hypothetical protein